jgi:hypothetical protein
MDLSYLEDMIFDYEKENGVQCETMIINPKDYNKVSKELIRRFPDFVLTDDATFRVDNCKVYRSTDQKQGTVTLLRS